MPRSTCLIALMITFCTPTAMRSALSQGNPPDSSKSASTEVFQSPRYGVTSQLPKVWPILQQEKNEYIFVCQIPQPKFPDRPGIMALELAIAPESLDEYRTRIDTNAKRGNRKGNLVRNEIMPKSAMGMLERLETVWEFRLPDGEVWHEITVRIIRGKHLYGYVLNVEDETLALARKKFEQVIASTEYSTPDSGAAKVNGAPTNRWIQTEFHFAVDLPEKWAPLLAPNEAALLYANGVPKGIWADNMLVVATKMGKVDYAKLADSLPDDLEAAEPGCVVKSCKVIKTASGAEALETVVEVKRGPFAMTIHEWRFAGKRFNYELKFTVESARYEGLKAAMQKCFDSFQELPGEVPELGKAQSE